MILATVSISMTIYPQIIMVKVIRDQNFIIILMLVINRKLQVNALPNCINMLWIVLIFIFREFWSIRDATLNLKNSNNENIKAINQY